METRIIKIRGMVCRRCIAIVKEIFSTQGLPVGRIELGQVTVNKQDNLDQLLPQINTLLLQDGFELLDDKEARIIAKVKELVHQSLQNEEGNSNFAALVAEELHMDYGSVSSLFSAIEGLTIEKYVIEKRIEKVREMLVYTNLSLTDIAYSLGYSSVHYLSNQFKSVTGLSPSDFRKIKMEKEIKAEETPLPG